MAVLTLLLLPQASPVDTGQAVSPLDKPSSPAPGPHLWKEEEGEEVGHGLGGLGVVGPYDGHHPGHVVAVVLLDGQEVVILGQEVERRLDVVDK